jgi:hypothetical protein
VIESLLASAAERRGIPGLQLVESPTSGKDVTFESKPVSSKDGVAGRLWQWTHHVTYEEAVLGVFKKDGRAIGILMTGSEVLFMSRVIRSFMWFDPAAADSPIATLNGVNLTPERRKIIERGMVKGWGLLVSPSRQYVVIYNTNRGKSDRIAKRVAERVEAMRRQYYEVLFPSTNPITSASLVRICGNYDEYYEYGGPRGSAGYWNSDAEELVFYDAGIYRRQLDAGVTKYDENTFAALYHEAFHQYIHYAAGMAPHAWFNEGHGDYFAGATMVDGKLRIAPFSWRIATLNQAIAAGPRHGDEDPTVNESKSQVGYFPLKQLVHMTQRQYYLRPHVCYAQGWSLVYFLRSVVPADPAMNAKWGSILDTYFKVLREETTKPPAPGSPPDGPTKPSEPPSEGTGDTPPTPPADQAADDPGIPVVLRKEIENRKALDKALEAAFTGVDFDELEGAWLDAMRKLDPRGRR